MSLFSSPQQQFPDVRLCDILRIEDTPELQSFRCSSTQIPIWTQIRVPFFRHIIGDLVYSTANIQPPLQNKKSRAALSIARAFAHNAKLQITGMESDVLLTTEAIGDRLIDDKFLNRYVDPFSIRGSRREMVLSDLFEWNWPFPRHNNRLYIHSTIQTASALRWRLGISTHARRQARELTTLVSDRAQELLGWEIGTERRRNMEQRVAIKIMGLPVRYAAYSSLLRKVRPRLVISSSACYGFVAPLIVAAHEADIPTAEYQHGAICDGHDAYNFAPAVLRDTHYRRTLPQYYLSYGKWWHDQVNAPLNMVPIGYPARSERLESLRLKQGKRNEILILSDGAEFDLHLDLASKIAATLGGTGLHVCLRPHPLERTDALSRYGAQTGDVAIDQRLDLYEALGSAHSVISEGSTGLFEALGIVDKIIMLNTRKARFFFGRHPFVLASSEDETIEAIHGSPASSEAPPSSDVWAEGWEANYAGFLQEKFDIQCHI